MRSQVTAEDPGATAALEVTGPRFGLPHLFKLRRDPIRHAAALHQRYGQVMKLKVLGTEIYVTRSADAAEQILVNPDKVFASGPAWSHFIGPFFHRGLMLLDFEEHLHHRRIMQAAFTVDALKHYQAMMAPHIRTGVAAWADVPDPHLHPLLKQLTLELALEAFVGVDLDEAGRRRINEAFTAAVRAGTSIVRAPVPGGDWAKGLAARKVLEDFFRGALPDKRRNGGEDLFAQLCRARSEDGHEFTDQDVVNHMIFLLMAAHDTTTITLTSMAYQLARSPHWQERCREQSLEIGDIAPGEDSRLTLLDLVMKESLRLCSPVPSIPRTATRETTIAGYRIPAGSIVTVAPFQNHFLPQFWSEPERFDPERFAEGRHEEKAHRFAFEPFGGGAHKCIGMYFAGMAVRTILHEMLRRYRWSVPENYQMPMDLVALPVPRDGLPVGLEAL